MRTTLKIAVLVTVSLLLISVGAFVYPLMQDPFERQYVEPSNVSELENGFYLVYSLPNISQEFASATLFVDSSNKTVRVYYLHDGKQERLSSGKPFEEAIISGNLSNPKEIGTGWGYLFNATDAVMDSYDAGKVAFMVEMNKSALLHPYSGTEATEKSYPDMSLTYWKPSTPVCIILTIIFFLLFVLAAVATAIYAVVTREPTKQDDEK